MAESGYNGWRNYETWAVALWIDNEQGSYTYARERATEALEDADGDKQEAVSSLAEILKDEHEEANPLGDQASVYTDLLNAALSEVYWREIAENYIDEVAAEAAAEA